MSVCHIWFGVDRSNRRGGTLIFRRAFFFSAIIPTCASCSRTVEGLAFIQNSRRSTWEMRRTPWRGSSRLSATIFSCTASGSLDRLTRGPDGMRSNPACPC